MDNDIKAIADTARILGIEEFAISGSNPASYRQDGNAFIPAIFDEGDVRGKCLSVGNLPLISSFIIL